MNVPNMAQNLHNCYVFISEFSMHVATYANNYHYVCCHALLNIARRHADMYGYT